MSELMPGENVSSAENQQERIIERAKELLGDAYNAELVSSIFERKGSVAFEELEEVRTSTNPQQRRKYLNDWYKENK